MKYFLWAGTLAILALFGFILSGLLSTPHPSLAEQAQSAPPTTPFPATSETPPERFTSSEPLSESTPQASSPAPVLDDPKKQAALAELVKAKAEMQALRPPRVDSTDPSIIAGSINAYVNQMGQRAQAYNQAKAALTERLSKQEATRLSQILAQP